MQRHQYRISLVVFRSTLSRDFSETPYLSLKLDHRLRIWYASHHYAKDAITANWPQERSFVSRCGDRFAQWTEGGKPCRLFGII